MKGEITGPLPQAIIMVLTALSNCLPLNESLKNAFTEGLIPATMAPWQKRRRINVASTSLHMQLLNFLIPALMIMFTSALYAACGNTLVLKVFPEKAGIASAVQGAVTVLAGALLFIPAALFGHYHTGTVLSSGFLVIALLCGALFWWQYH